MARRQLQDKRALVTGASGGIGRALAIELARAGADLVLFARREDKLASVAAEIAKLGRLAELVVGDVTDADARRRALETAQQKLGGLDLLVNNAGVSAHGRFADADPDRLRPIMETNFFAAVELTRTALPLLKSGRESIVVNIGSVLGRRGCPHKSEYSASKFALTGFSEALRAELAPQGIDVLLVTAGPTDTEFFQHLLEEHGELPWGEGQPVSPERVARATVRAIEQGRHEIVPSWRGWLMLTANRFFPRLVDRAMARYG
jgi:short-subunit dehydrogenase